MAGGQAAITKKRLQAAARIEFHIKVLSLKAIDRFRLQRQSDWLRFSYTVRFEIIVRWYVLAICPIPDCRRTALGTCEA
jgi:hypothetical protein